MAKNPDYSNTIGATIRAIRRSRNLRQKDLAEACNMPPAALCKIESGANGTTVATAERIAKALGVPVADIISPGHASPPIAGQCAEFVVTSVDAARRIQPAQRRELEPIIAFMANKRKAPVKLPLDAVTDIDGAAAEMLAHSIRAALDIAAAPIDWRNGILEQANVALLATKAKKPVSLVAADGRAIIAHDGECASIARELAHVALCASNDNRPVSGSYRIFAERFARALLLPASAMRRIAAGRNVKPSQWTREHVESIARTYYAGKDEVVCRLGELGLIDPAVPLPGSGKSCGDRAPSN